MLFPRPFLYPTSTRSWVRKKHPRLLEYVPIPERSKGDALRSMTVIPYLRHVTSENGRRCRVNSCTDEEEEDDEDSQEYYTEHDLQGAPSLLLYCN